MRVISYELSQMRLPAQNRSPNKKVIFSMNIVVTLLAVFTVVTVRPAFHSISIVRLLASIRSVSDISGVGLFEC